MKILGIIDPSALAFFDFCLFLTWIGFVVIGRDLATFNSKRTRITEFLDNLKAFMESKGTDREAYGKMVYQSALIQGDLGDFGVMSYKPPGANYFIHNYQLVVNMLSELDQWIHTDDVFHVFRPGQGLARTIHEALLRYLGVLDQRIRQTKSNQRNPLLVMREGISWLLSLPIATLAFLGLAGESLFMTLRHSLLMRLVSAVLTLVTILSAIVSLFAGWSQFVAIIKGWL
ncbi:MAG: hypothetical protein ABSF91_01705 [Bacteroidota bacterium]|jgi:hypothetical protein